MNILYLICIYTFIIKEKLFQLSIAYNSLKNFLKRLCHEIFSYKKLYLCQI